MPEQITKYPDVTLKVLKDAGAACGQGVPQKILKQCRPTVSARYARGRCASTG